MAERFRRQVRASAIKSETVLTGWPTRTATRSDPGFVSYNQWRASLNLSPVSVTAYRRAKHRLAAWRALTAEEQAQRRAAWEQLDSAIVQQLESSLD